MPKPTVFLRPLSTYTRNIDPIGHYIEQTANYLAVSTGDSLEQCREFVIRGIKEKGFKGLNDPVVHYFERQENGDREQVKVKLTEYIHAVIRNKEILAPSFTTYVNTRVKKSVLSGFVKGNVKKRSKAKKEAFKAKAEGKMNLFVIKNNEQTNKKLFNNSLSGAFATKGSVLLNPTAHSTLTSTTRTVSSFGNASNERLIAGNRHYWSPETVLNNLIVLTTQSDLAEINAVIQRFQLHYPTTEEVMRCVTYSSDLYWLDHRALIPIRAYVERLSPVQKAAFVYTGDLYHLRLYNESFMREFLGALSKRCTTDAPCTAKEVEDIDEQVLNLVHQICSADLKSQGKDYAKMEANGKLKIVLPTAINVLKTLDYYQDFITAFFLSRNVPASIAFIPNMLRRAVVMSDTDSTCFSLDEWVKWYRGEFIVDETSLAVASSVAFMATQSMMHILALFSGNINVAPEELHTLACKPEWVWTSFQLTQIAKHYSAYAIVQESNVFAEPELEIKGVHLKSSNAPPRLTKQAEKLMEMIHESVLTNTKISLVKILTDIADTERLIIASLLNGDLEFYRQSKIKDGEAYSKGVMESPYQHHDLWNSVFKPKYGPIDEPPYGVAKVPTTLNNPTKLKEWLENIQDKELADRMRAWLLKYKKTSFPTFYISTSYLSSYGMPIEIRSVIDTPRIVADLCNVFYIILESLNYFVKSGFMLSKLGY